MIFGLFSVNSADFSVYSATGKVTINEICGENTFYKAPDGNIYAWLELYNGTSSEVDISGWGISDDPKDPYKFSLPAEVYLPSGQRKIIFCNIGETPDFETAQLDFTKEENTALITDRFGHEVDRVVFGRTEKGKSYGQFPDGSGNYFVAEPTPLEANVSQNTEIKITAQPSFSHESGFYDKDFMLKIEAPDGMDVYYTTDGSEPTTDSKKYNAMIRVTDPSEKPNVWSARTDISSYGATAPRKAVDKAFVIRAVVADKSGRIGESVTATYFLGNTDASYYKDMKVISIVTDPENLFDYNTGIYVKGKYYDMYYSSAVEAWNKIANYTQKGREWEREAVFEVFDSGKHVLSQNVGIRIKGATSRSTPQKSFNIYARDEYGKSKLEYDFFGGKAVSEHNGEIIDSFDSLTIRNAGNDTSFSYLRDNINQSLVSDRGLTMQTMDECVVFIDGEFWGFYTLTEKVSDSYIKNHYGVKKKDVVIIKNNDVEEGDNEDWQDWNDTIRKYAGMNMTADENYKAFCEDFDVDSFIEYFAVQIYWCNADWPWNNFAVWKSKNTDESNPYADGRWRMLLFDTDFSTGLFRNTDTGYRADGFSRIRGYSDSFSRTFCQLLRNPEFKERFCMTFMDIANGNFSPEKTEKIIDYYREAYRQPILDTCERFYAGAFTSNSGASRFDSECDIIADFYKNRFAYATDDLKNHLGISGSLKNVTVISNGRQGRVDVNTISPDFTANFWRGKYFSDYKITFKAYPEKDFKFVKWEVTGAELSEKQLENPEIEIAPENDISVKAVYEKIK